ncbi:MAG: hypothetical protein QXU40_02305 [Candidatus Pacearchaeota archaeon]
MPRGKISFDKLSGINYDVPATKTGLNSFTELFGLSPSILENSLSLSKDILFHDTIGDGSDLVFVDRYYSKTYGNTIIFIKGSNHRPYVRYKNSSGVYVISELPAPPDFPAATDWNGVQIDTRYYLQSYSSKKRYIIRFDSDIKLFTEIRLEVNNLNLLLDRPPRNFEIEYQTEQHTEYSISYFLEYGNTGYSVIKKRRESDFDKQGAYLWFVPPSSNVYIFASSSVDQNSLPEERLIASVVNGKFIFSFVNIVFGRNELVGPGGIGTYIYTIDDSNNFNYISLLCYFYSIKGTGNIVGQKLFINENEFIITDLWYEPGGSFGSYVSYIKLDRQLSSDIFPARATNFRLEIQVTNYTPLFIPLYGNDNWGGTKTIYGDLISNYTTFSENIDAYGKAVVYADGFLFNGSPRYKNEDYENYITNSFINNLGLRQPLSFPITNLTPLGSKSGTMLLMKEKFGRIYIFTSESIFIVNSNQGKPIILEPIEINITSKYHIVEFLNGFFIYSGFKIWRLGYDGISEIPGMNKYFLDNNINQVYLSWNSIDSELMVYVTPSLKRIFIYNYDRNTWRSWIPEFLSRFVLNYAEDGISYHIDLNGNIYSVTSKFSKALFFEAILEFDAFKRVDISEIRINGNFSFSNIIAQLVFPDQSVENLSVKSSPQGFLQLFRDESKTIKEKRINLRVFQSISDTVTKFNIYGIEVFGLFEELEGNYPNELLTTY